ncbi:MAG: ABC transporter transmembrane domain-containing protein [Thiolinea sp.]
MSLMLWVPLAILVVTAAHDWLSALVMVVTAPLIPAFMILIGKGTEKRNQRQWQTLARMSAHFLDVIQGLTTLKLFNASRQEAEMVAAISERYRRQTMSVLRVAFLSSFMLEFCPRSALPWSPYSSVSPAVGRDGVPARPVCATAGPGILPAAAQYGCPVSCPHGSHRCDYGNAAGVGYTAAGDR